MQFLLVTVYKIMADLLPHEMIHKRPHHEGQTQVFVYNFSVILLFSSIIYPDSILHLTFCFHVSN